jgi:hypothetical protein
MQSSASKVNLSRFNSKLDSKSHELTNLSRVMSHKDQLTELQSRIMELQRQLEEEKRKGGYVQLQAERREQRFAKKEVEFRRALKHYDDLFREMSGAEGVGELTLKNIERIGSMYKQIQTGLNEMQDRRTEELRRQESDIIKQFDDRLREAAAQVEAEKQLKLKQLGAMVEQDSKLASQYELMKASVIMIEQKNTELERANKELRVKCSLLQSESQLLMSKNCSLRRGKSETTRNADLQLSAFHSLPNFEPKLTGKELPMFSLPDEQILDRQERIIAKLRRSLEQEKARLSAARTTYTRELTLKQDLRDLLKSCCEEVYKDLVSANESFSNVETRQAVVKALESQLRMLTLIYDRMFQTNHSGESDGHSLTNSLHQGLFANLKLQGR